MEKKNSRSRVLKAAIDLFAVKGFAATSISDIMKAVDLSASSIYHYFGDKENLMVSVLDAITTPYLEDLRNILKKKRKPVDRFRLLIENHVILIVKHWKSAKIANIDQENLPSEGNELNRKAQRTVLNIYLEELERLEELGYLRPINRTVLAFSILGMIMWVARWYRPSGKLSLETISREMANFILYGALNEKGPDRSNP